MTDEDHCVRQILGLVARAQARGLVGAGQVVEQVQDQLRRLGRVADDALGRGSAAAPPAPWTGCARGPGGRPT